MLSELLKQLKLLELLKFLEFIENHAPNSLEAYFDKDIFVYANVPYKIKKHEDILKNPKDTIDFDEKSDHAIRARRNEMGASVNGGRHRSAAPVFNRNRNLHRQRSGRDQSGRIAKPATPLSYQAGPISRGFHLKRARSHA